MADKLKISGLLQGWHQIFGSHLHMGLICIWALSGYEPQLHLQILFG